MFFQFQNKAARLLEKQKIKQSLNVFYVVNAVSTLTSDLWPSTFFSQGCKNNLSDTCDIDFKY